MSRLTKTVLLLILMTVVTGLIYTAYKPQSNVELNSLLAALARKEAELINQWRSIGGLKNDLELGSRGTAVRILQHGLAQAEALSYPDHLVTGYYGPITQQAVTEWQRHHGLPPVGRVGPQTRARLNEIYFSRLCPESNNRYNDKRLEPVSREHSLPTDYVPADLVDITDRVRTIIPTCLTTDTADYLKRMFEAAEKDDLYLAVTSGFRRTEIQDLIHQYHFEQAGESALDFSAQPGHSEHQLGTTVDLTGRSINYQPVTPKFDTTPEKAWLKKNAYRYGFVLSYSKGETEQTGFQYEPWHWRFIGPEHARVLKELDLNLLEYLEQLHKSNEMI